MTTYTFTHLPPQGKAPGRFVIKAPGPAFDLIYARHRRSGESHTVWQLDLKSKPPDVALRALLTECARAALVSDAWLAGSARVAEMLSEPAFAEVRDIDSSSARRTEESTLVSTPALRAALGPLVRHWRELSRRPHVAERFERASTGELSLFIGKGLLRYQPGGRLRAPICRSVHYVVTIDLATLSAFQSGEQASLPATVEIAEPTAGAIEVWLSSALKSALAEGTLVLREGLSPSEQMRALRRLAAVIREPMTESAHAVQAAEDESEPLARAAELLGQHSDVARADPGLLPPIAKRASGLTPMQLAEREKPAAILPRTTVEVSDALRRFCALYEWPQGNSFSFRGINKQQVYEAPEWRLDWEAPDGSHHFFMAELESMRLIAEGVTTSLEVSVSPVRPRR